MPYLKTSTGILWNYETKGENEPIVFLHGWGADLRLWNAQAEYFSRGYKVISIDLPGHGRSSWERISLVQITRDLEEISKILNLEKINLVGSSLGGLIAFQWFDLFPKRFKRIILIGAFPKFLQADDYPFGLEPQRLRKLDAQLTTDYPAMVNIFFRSLFTRWERESTCFKYIAQFRKNGIVPLKEALREFLDILEKEDLRPTLSKLSQSALPIQILNGTDDYICSKDTVGFLKEKLPQARLKLFEDCGHFPFLSQPHAFNAVLEEFLKA